MSFSLPRLFFAPNTVLNPGTGGDVISDDQITTLNGAGIATNEKVQRIKIAYGSPASATDVTVSTPFPVQAASTLAAETTKVIGTVNIAAPGIAAASLSTPVVQNIETASGTITTQNLVPGGAATAGSAVEITLAGASTLTVQVVGTYSGALNLQVMADGANWVTVGGLPMFNINTGVFLSAITSTLQSAFQSEVAGFLKARITGLSPMTGSVVVTIRASPNTSIISLGTSLPSGFSTIGAVNIAALQSLSVKGLTVNGNTLSTLNAAATTNATLLKASAGTIYAINAMNASAALRYVRIYNLTVAPTVGTSIPIMVIAIPSTSSKEIQFSLGITMSTGISYSITGGASATDATVVAAGDVQLAINWI